MPNRLRDNINSQYFEAANALKSKQARRRIVAYVESYDDIYFWRTVLSEFENDKRYFEENHPELKVKSADIDDFILLLGGGTDE